MATLQSNKFTTFSMSHEEVATATSTITPETQMWLQNLFTQANEARLEMSYDHSEPYKFLQEEAYQKGRADILGFILAVIPSEFSISTSQATQEN